MANFKHLENILCPQRKEVFLKTESANHKDFINQS